MYPNIEKRAFYPSTNCPKASYCGWNNAGDFYYVGKGGMRGNLWWAYGRDKVTLTIYGKTLREISEKLAKIDN